MTIEEIISSIRNKASDIKPLGKTLKFVIEGDIIIIDGTGESNTFSSEDRPADCTITMSRETYVMLQRREIKPFMAALSGRVKAEGDLSVAKKFRKLTS